MYNQNSARALEFMGFVAAEDFDLVENKGVFTLYWNSVEPQPTDQQIADTEANPAFQAWLAEHGGDPVLTLRRQAREALAAQRGEDMRTRAALIEIIKEFNRHADHHNAIVSAITGASNFAQVQSALTALGDYPQRTPAQLQALVSAAIDAGEAD